MHEQQPNQPEPETGGETPSVETQAVEPKPTLRQRWERIPPRYRTKKWLIGGGVAAALVIMVAGNSLCNLANAPDDPDPEPVAAADVPTPAPASGLIPDRPTPTPLPSQYAFTHFVEEMANCYEQRGLDGTPEGVEADIMQDVPLAVNSLLRLYTDNLCEERDPWHQIRGRVGWMLRAADVPLPELPEPTQQ